MTKTYIGADQLASAFPLGLRDDVLTAVATFPAVRELGGTFSVLVGADRVTIPRRLHFDVSLVHVEGLTTVQREIVDCLLTRHTSGHLRQQHLTRIIGLSRAWIPPFVIQLAGEYVVEILRVIDQNLQSLDAAIYSTFVRNNPQFLELTGQRIASYWDCYYRNERRNEYVGFRILEFFRSLQRSA